MSKRGFEEVAANVEYMNELAYEEPEKKRRAADAKECFSMDELVEEQRDVVNRALAGESFFLTGIAGSGKSATLRACIYMLNKKYEDIDKAKLALKPDAKAPKNQTIHVRVTGTTGMASILINGRTLCGLLGSNPTIKERMSPDEQINYFFAKKNYIGRQLRGSSVVIVDEVSMMDGADLEVLAGILRGLSPMGTRTSPFGKFQVILCGDPCQLPPINAKGGKFFQHEVFKRAFPREHCICLTTNHRQNGDILFQYALLGVRLNVRNDYMRRIFGLLARPFAQRLHQTTDKCSFLFSKNVDVNAHNEKVLRSIPGESRTYHVEYSGDEEITKTLFSKVIPEKLELKVGSFVRLSANVDVQARLVNGTTGTVIKLLPDSIVVELTDLRQVTLHPYTWEVDDATCTQIPVRLSDAFSVHGGQGSTMVKIQGNVSDIFSDNQTYVLLSRVESIKSAYITGLVTPAGGWVYGIERILRFDAAALKFFNDMFGEDLLTNRMKEMEPQVQELLKTARI